MKQITAIRNLVFALAIFLASVFCPAASAESEKPITLDDVIGVWELEGVYYNGETVYSGEDFLRVTGKPMIIEFTSDGLWIIEGGEQAEVYDLLHLQDNILPDGSSLKDEILSITVEDVPGTVMRYVRSSLPGRESAADVDPAGIGRWVLDQLDIRKDSASLAILSAEEFSERYNVPIPTVEVRKSGFVLLTFGSHTDIFPAGEWELAQDRLIWPYAREDGKNLIWYFIRENEIPAND